MRRCIPRLGMGLLETGARRVLNLRTLRLLNALPLILLVGLGGRSSPFSATQNAARRSTKK